MTFYGYDTYTNEELIAEHREILAKDNAVALNPWNFDEIEANDIEDMLEELEEEMTKRNGNE